MRELRDALLSVFTLTLCVVVFAVAWVAVNPIGSIAFVLVVVCGITCFLSMVLAVLVQLRINKKERDTFIYKKDGR